MALSSTFLTVYGPLLCLLISFASPIEGAGDDAFAAAPVDPTLRKMWMTHGILMAFAWGVLVPCAIGSAILRDALTRIGVPKGKWFVVHLALNGTAVVLTFISFLIGIFAFIRSGDPHFHDEHPKYGLVVFIMVVVQACLGFVRPKLPGHGAALAKEEDSTEDEESNIKSASKPTEKSSIRRYWEYTHRLVGVTVVGLAWYQCTTGLALLPQFIGNQPDLNTLNDIFWGVTGGIAGITFLLAYVVRV
jgi:hypothetical protein